MKNSSVLCLVLLLAGICVAAQTGGSDAMPGADYSGMYSFVREGEFVQVTIEDAGKVTGFVSRYGDLESDKGAFLDQFFKQGALQGSELNFNTETVHGVWYEFKGRIERGSGKTVAEESYYLMKGTLTEYSVDSNKKTTSKIREVVFKSFPQDTAPPPSQRN